jgi:HK97 family phage major capsid protein
MAEMEIKQLHDEMLRLVTEFRTYAEREREEIKKVGVSAPETKDALSRLNERISELETKQSKAPVKTEPSEDEKAATERKAFSDWVRKGDRMSAQSREILESKAHTVGTAGDGGYVVPKDLDRMIYDKVLNDSPMRQVCSTIRVGSDNYEKLVNLHGAGTGWVGETDARNTTNTATFTNIVPTMGEIYANAPASQKVLDDAMIDMESFIVSEIGSAIAIAEGTAFVSGNGTNRPKGLLGYTIVNTADATRTWGELQYIATGAAGAFATNTPDNTLVDTVYALKAKFRAGSKWMTNKAVLAAIRKWKTSAGENLYIWQPSLQAGQPSSLLGYPVVENEDMPTVANNSYSIAFGNFPLAYQIVDRIGIRVLRDPYTSKPNVLFYVTKRVGNLLLDSEAVKLVKFAAS